MALCECLHNDMFKGWAIWLIDNILIFLGYAAIYDIYLDIRTVSKIALNTGRGLYLAHLQRPEDTKRFILKQAYIKPRFHKERLRRVPAVLRFLFRPPHDFIPHRQCFRSRSVFLTAMCCWVAQILLIWSFFLGFCASSVLVPLVRLKFWCSDVIYDRECAQGVLFRKLTGCSMPFLYLTSCPALWSLTRLLSKIE